MEWPTAAVIIAVIFAVMVVVITWLEARKS